MFIHCQIYGETKQWSFSTGQWVDNHLHTSITDFWCVHMLGRCFICCYQTNDQSCVLWAQTSTTSWPWIFLLHHHHHHDALWEAWNEEEPLILEGEGYRPRKVVERDGLASISIMEIQGHAEWAGVDDEHQPQHHQLLQMLGELYFGSLECYFWQLWCLIPEQVWVMQIPESIAYHIWQYDFHPWEDDWDWWGGRQEGAWMAIHAEGMWGLGRPLHLGECRWQSGRSQSSNYGVGLHQGWGIQTHGIIILLIHIMAACLLQLISLNIKIHQLILLIFQYCLHWQQCGLVCPQPVGPQHQSAREMCHLASRRLQLLPHFTPPQKKLCKTRLPSSSMSHKVQSASTSTPSLNKMSSRK